MSIASELTRLQNAKAAIKQSLENKGATIDSSAKLSDYPSIIDNLPSGGDNSVLKDLLERDITSIEIPSGTTTIGTYIFDNCHNLTSVTIPNSVTSIGVGAFGHCGIRTILIPNSVTTIGELAFKGSDLVSITIPSSVTIFGAYVFAECTSLTNVTFENYLTTLPIGTFKSSSLTLYVIPNTVTTIGNQAFSSCSSLTSITIPSSVTSLGVKTFELCSSLTSITLPSSITSIGTYCFLRCSGLTSITVEATTPPTLGTQALYNNNDCPIYVPCESVQAYKTDTNWSVYADRITCVGGADEPNNTVKLIQGGCYANSAESTFTYDLDGSGINYTLTGFEVANDLYYILVTGGNSLVLVTLDYDGPTIKAGDTVTLIDMPDYVQGTDVDTWNIRGIYFGFKIDSGVTTLKVTIDTTNNTYTLKAL